MTELARVHWPDESEEEVLEVFIRREPDHPFTFAELNERVEKVHADLWTLKREVRHAGRDPELEVWVTDRPRPL